MINVCAIGYLLSFLIYFIWGDSSRFWGGFNICTQLYFYCIALYAILRSVRPTRLQSILVKNVIVITVARGLYTTLCIYCTDVDTVNTSTTCFTVLICAYVIVLFLYLIYLHYQLSLFSKLMKCLIEPV